MVFFLLCKVKAAHQHKPETRSFKNFTRINRKPHSHSYDYKNLPFKTVPKEIRTLLLCGLSIPNSLSFHTRDQLATTALYPLFLPSSCRHKLTKKKKTAAGALHYNRTLYTQDAKSIESVMHPPSPASRIAQGRDSYAPRETYPASEDVVDSWAHARMKVKESTGDGQ